MGTALRYRELIVGVAIAGVLIVAFTLIGPSDWPGEVSGCLENDDCYCETLRTDGLAVQPANSVSNIGFMAVGLTILWGVGHRRRSLSLLDNSSLASERWGRWLRARRGDGGGGDRYLELPPALFGFMAIGLGVGSALFHGTMKAWAGWADLVSMYAFIGLVLAHNLRRLQSWSRQRFLAVYGAIVGSLAIIQLPLEEGLGKWVFAGLIAATLLTEFLAAERAVVRRDRRWLWWALGVFAAAFVVWNLSRTGGTLCDPDSLLQGHAVWHLATAASVAAIYRYLRSESTPARRHSDAAAGT